MGLASTLLAVALTWATLFRKPLATRAVRPYIRALQTGVGALRQVHNGIIADYVTWLTVGLAAFGAPAALCSGLSKAAPPLTNNRTLLCHFGSDALWFIQVARLQ